MATTWSCGDLDRLPSEVRLAIYEYALGHEFPIPMETYLRRWPTTVASLSAHRVESATPPASPAVPLRPTALLRSCRKIYQEALPVLYHSNAIAFLPRAWPFWLRSVSIYIISLGFSPGYLPRIDCHIPCSSRAELLEALACLKRVWERPTHSPKHVKVRILAGEHVDCTDYGRAALYNEAWGDVEKDAGDRLTFEFRRRPDLKLEKGLVDWKDGREED